MIDHHLSVEQQQAYLIDPHSADALNHLTACSECRAAVDRLESTLHLFRASASSWADQCLTARPQARHLQSEATTRRPLALLWTLGLAIPVLLFVMAMLPFRSSTPLPAHSPAHLTDDALLQQVDDQLSVAVPSSMESLTHLVSTSSQSSTTTTHPRSKPLGQIN